MLGRLYYLLLIIYSKLRLGVWSPPVAIKPQSTVELSQYPEDYLDAVAEELNDRLRKTLEYDKPSERILKLLA
ncbi:hypothetical protein FRC0433_00285 [Corynebacterium diphtheriae]|nr:hypothetical protein FRC0433_00285 [Corynebacterium diphtheriae]